MISSELSPFHAGLRFFIEVAALACWGIAGWHLTGSPLRWLLAIGLPLAGATVWGTFRTPGDASANGGAPVPVSGVVRLAIEFDVLIGAAIAVAAFWRPWPGILLAVAVVAHYAMTVPRVRWLLAQR